MLSTEVDSVAVETGIVDTPGFSVVHEGTSTVLRHRPAQACARIAPGHRTQAETAHTLHIVATLVARDVAVLPPSHPAPVERRCTAQNYARSAKCNTDWTHSTHHTAGTPPDRTPPSSCQNLAMPSPNERTDNPMWELAYHSGIRRHRYPTR